MQSQTQQQPVQQTQQPAQQVQQQPQTQQMPQQPEQLHAPTTAEEQSNAVDKIQKMLGMQQPVQQPAQQPAQQPVQQPAQQPAQPQQPQMTNIGQGWGQGITGQYTPNYNGQ